MVKADLAAGEHGLLEVDRAAGELGTVEAELDLSGADMGMGCTGYDLRGLTRSARLIYGSLLRRRSRCWRRLGCHFPNR
jgi:hypothetical protein